MINPLDALSALQSGQIPGANNIGFVPTSGALPDSGMPIGEGFNSLMKAGQASLDKAGAQAAISNAAPLAGGADPATWGHMVQQMVMDVNSKQQSAAQKVSDVLQGGPTPVHDAMIATEEASLSFQFLAEMRNKVVDAYQQVMQMQV